MNIDFDSIKSGAEKKAKRIMKAEAINAARKENGLPPLYDDQGNLIKRTAINPKKIGISKTTDAAQAIMAINKARKKAVLSDLDELEPPEIVEEVVVQQKKSDNDTQRAIKEAEAARKVQDMKNGRIDHSRNWNPESDYSVEGGDKTSMFRRGEVKRIVSGKEDKKEEPAEGVAILMKRKGEKDSEYIYRLFCDLYTRLDRSFSAMETTMSDLQGRVSELVGTESKSEDPAEKPEPQANDEYDKFIKVMSGSTQVIYDIGSAKLSVDAVCVYHQAPCLTVVTKVDSACVSVNPGTRLRLSFDDNGERRDSVQVSYLGTEFTIKDLGLRFSGFIVDSEAGDVDVSTEG